MWPENITYENRYQDWREQYGLLFAQGNRYLRQDEQFRLMVILSAPAPGVLSGSKAHR